MARRKTQDATITIRDIAKHAGFSPSTVSMVLNNAPLARYIRQSTKRRIEAVARRLGYRPNQLARSLRSQRNRTVGVMVFDIHDPFCTPILRGIESTLYQASYVPIFTDAHNDRSRFERYLEMLLERRIEGLLVIANWLFVDIDILGDLEKRNVPTVVIGRELKTDSISSVMVDNTAGSAMALEHLHKLGHREIAFIRGPKSLGDTAPRWRGVRSFARSVGLTIDPKLVTELPDQFDPDLAFDAGYRLTEELLRHRRSFSALMAFDDITALGALRALSKAGLRVPEQCSLIGFDDTSPAALAAPPLTTIRQPMELMGATAVQIITDNVNAGLEKKSVQAVHRLLAPELIVRDSTQPLR